LKNAAMIFGIENKCLKGEQSYIHNYFSTFSSRVTWSVSWIFFERKGEITVIGKGNKERTVPVSAEARRAIERYLEDCSDELNTLFIGNYHNQICIRAVQRIE
jgi:site-specific recombinase XerC